MLTRIVCYCVLLTNAFAAPPAGRPKASSPKTSASSCCAAAAALPAAALGSVSFTGGAVNVVVNGTTAYGCGNNAIGVIDISNPASPRLLSTFAQSDFGGNAIAGCYQMGQSLVVPVNTQSGFVYDISDARNIRSLARFTPPLPFPGHISFAGNTGWFVTASFDYNTGNNLISNQHGEFYAVDFTDPAHPSTIGSLSPNSSQPASSNRSPRFGSISNGADTVYILSTTAIGGDTQGGQGAIQIIDVGNPQSPQGLAQITIPQATALVSAGLQDNIMIVAGNTKSWRNPGVNPRNNALNFQFTGVLTLTALDVTDWRNPVLLSTRCSDISTWSGTGIAPLGGGFFALATWPAADDLVATGTDPNGQLLLLDARDPTNMVLHPMASVPKLQGVSLAGDKLYAATGDGLSIFQVPDLSGL